MSGKSILGKYQLMVYVCLALFAIILGLVGHNLSEGTAQAILINLCSELFAVALLFFLFDFLIEKERTRRANEEISIVLKYGEKEVWFPVPLRRSEFSRNEVLGVVGMIPMKEGKQERFKIKHLSNYEFLSDVKEINKGDKGGKIIIRCTKEEMEQFNCPESWKRQAV